MNEQVTTAATIDPKDLASRFVASLPKLTEMTKEPPIPGATFDAVAARYPEYAEAFALIRPAYESHPVFTVHEIPKGGDVLSLAFAISALSHNKLIRQEYAAFFDGKITHFPVDLNDKAACDTINPKADLFCVYIRSGVSLPSCGLGQA